MSQHYEEAGKRWSKVFHRKSPLLCNGSKWQPGAVFLYTPFNRRRLKGPEASNEATQQRRRSIVQKLSSVVGVLFIRRLDFLSLIPIARRRSLSLRSRFSGVPWSSRKKIACQWSLTTKPQCSRSEKSCQYALQARGVLSNSLVKKKAAFPKKDGSGL